MKKTLLLLYVLTFVFCNIGCKKTPFDFRNKYCGDYNFVYSYYSWQLNLGVYATDTINYSGKVYYSIENKIEVDYNPNLSLELGITQDGNLSLPCGTIIGKFEDDNNLTLNYNSNSCGHGGLGGGSNYSIIGKKK